MCPMNSRALSTSLLVVIACAASSCAGLAPTSDPAPVVRGPLSTRQQHPMALTLMAFRPRRAVTQPEGEFGVGAQVAWATIEEIQRGPAYNPNETVAFDGETLRTTLRTRYGLRQDLDIEVELPFLYAWAGGMDQIIEEYHSVLGLPGGAREFYPDDGYDMRVFSHGDELYSLEGNRLALQDIPIFLTWQLTEEREEDPAIAARFGIELPTGSESGGFGNGALDFGAGLLAEKSFHRWSVFGGFDWVVPGQTDRLRNASGDHHYDPMLALNLSGEYRWNDSLSVIVGTVWTSRMVHSVALEEIDREVFDFGVGAAWDVAADHRFQLSLHEDLVAATGSDLTLQVGWTWGY